MKVIILAGGKGTRLPKSAKNIPKLLVEIAGKPIIQHQIDLLEKHGLFDIRFALGYEAEQIVAYLKKKYGTNNVTEVGSPSKSEKNYEYVIEPKPLGTGGAIKFASSDLKNDFLVLNGDILSDIDFAKFIKTHENFSREKFWPFFRIFQAKSSKKFSGENFLGTISVFYVKNASDFGLIEIEGGKITKFLEKPEEKCSGYINLGFYILPPEIFSDFSRENFSIELDIFPKLAENGLLRTYIHKGFWIDAGTEERLKLAGKLIKINKKQ